MMEYLDRATAEELDVAWESIRGIDEGPEISLEMPAQDVWAFTSEEDGFGYIYDNLQALISTFADSSPVEFESQLATPVAMILGDAIEQGEFESAYNEAA